MTNEEKQLLLQDLCARLPYDVKLLYNSNSIAKIKDRIEILRGITIGYTIWFETNYIHSAYDSTSGSYEHFKPYLRPLSSMTEEEKTEVQMFTDIVTDENYGDGYSPSAWDAMNGFVQYCDSHHLDHRGLIFRGLALAAPEGMY